MPHDVVASDLILAMLLCTAISTLLGAWLSRTMLSKAEASWYRRLDTSSRDNKEIFSIMSSRLDILAGRVDSWQATAARNATMIGQLVTVLGTIKGIDPKRLANAIYDIRVAYPTRGDAPEPRAAKKAQLARGPRPRGEDGRFVSKGEQVPAAANEDAPASILRDEANDDKS